MMETAEASSDEEATTVPFPEAWRIEVLRHPDREDPEGEHVSGAFRELGLTPPRRTRVARGVLLAPDYDRSAIDAIASELLADPVVDVVRIAAPGQGFGLGERPGLHRVLVQRQPGVMDPVARTIEDLLVRIGRTPASGTPGIGTYRAFELEGPNPTELELATKKLLANETIENVRIDREDLPYGKPTAQTARGRVQVELLAANADELERISTEGQLSLTLVEMRAIQEHFEALGREPSACELETIAQTWSEHCKHKTLTGIVEFENASGEIERIDNLLKSTIARATHELDRDFCVSVFVDNAGIIAFDEGWDICIKVETHNHPSAIDPYGGAGTGIGGVIRDVLGAGLGAKPIANTDCFFVGPPDLARDAVPKGSMHPRRILRGVVAGVRDYGNRMGIPTVNGGVWFDEGYVANPLVYAGTIGLMPRSAATKEVRPGDVIVTVGGRTGRDGIHGATFSSIELSEHSETVSSSAVQIGDPITEKRVLDGLLRARDLGLYRGITDCGAGGFSSAVGEMGEHTGAEVDLANVPLKYPGLSSHEIWISEAQERMVLAVPPEHVERLLAVFAAEDVEATVIGRFTDTKTLVVKDGEAVVAELGMGFLHDGAPRPTRTARFEAPDVPDPGCPRPESFESALLSLLASPNISSKEWIIRQYDHEVQGMSVVKPLVGVRADGPSDGAVLRPLQHSWKGLTIACGALPSYGKLDPYAMALAAIDEALRNAVAVGADPDHAAILDNFSWGNCDKPRELGALVLACQACYDGALAYGTPFVSGKDSLNNEYRVGDRTISIPPTLLITCIARVNDVRRAVTMDAKQAGNELYLVGTTGAELGGSQYFELEGLFGGRVPRPDLALAPQILRAMHQAISGGLAASVHDLSDGGLAVAAAEMAFAGELGIDLDVGAVTIPGLEPGYDADAVRAFSESCTRFLVEVAPEHAADFERAFASLPCRRVGAVIAEPRLRLRSGSTVLTDLALESTRQAFTGGFRG